MRSTFSGLNTMVLGIYANQVSQETVGHNITNANTEGFSRQSVNLAAIRANQQPSLYGNVMVGAGVDSMSITRARDIFADRQYWLENSTSVYLETRQKQYQKIESIFDDTTNNDIEKTLEDFFSAWETLSVDASLSSPRINVIGKAKTFADYVHTASQKLQEQINTNYADMSLNVTKMNNIMEQITQLNKAITSAEATGASANDLRDQRDLLTDELSTYTNIHVKENELGMYQIVSNGITLVNGIHNLTLQMSTPIYNEVYGVSDYVIQIKETTGLTFSPENGAMKALADAIAEDKQYIDHMASMSAFMLSKLNDVHRQGLGIDSVPTGGLNFYGDYNTNYIWEEQNDSTPAGITGPYIKADRYEEHWETNAPQRSDGLATFTYKGTPKTEYLQGINIIKELEVCSVYSEPDGEKLVAARRWGEVAGEVDVTYERVTSYVQSDGTETKEVEKGSALKGVEISSLLDGAYVTCGSSEPYHFKGIIRANGSNDMTDWTIEYVSDNVTGYVNNTTGEFSNVAPADDVSDQWTYVTSTGSVGSTYTISRSGNITSANDVFKNHGVCKIVDTSGKEYTNAGYDTTSGSMILRDSEGTNYIIDPTGTVQGYQFGTLSPALVEKETLKPVYWSVYEANGTGDGSNAVRLAALFNVNDDNRLVTDPLGTLSVNNYYNKAMTKLGSDSEATNMKIEAQEEVMLQIEEWRQSTSGVNWNEELTNMLKFQQGFSACSRCLTTMDEMLDRLINSTGMVGR